MSEARDIGEVPAVELINTVAVHLMSAAAVKLGLADDGEAEIDLDEARKLLNALAGLVTAAAPEISDSHARPLRDGLRSLQLRFREALSVPGRARQGPGREVDRTGQLIDASRTPIESTRSAMSASAAQRPCRRATIASSSALVEARHRRRAARAAPRRRAGRRGRRAPAARRHGERSSATLTRNASSTSASIARNPRLAVASARNAGGGARTRSASRGSTTMRSVPSAADRERDPRPPRRDRPGRRVPVAHGVRPR